MIHSAVRVEKKKTLTGGGGKERLPGRDRI